MTENGVTDKVIGISLDGTGYGTDGTIWGGEVLLADPAAYERIGMLKPFVQAGGDLASREGWRIALSLIYDATGSREETLAIARELYLAGEKDLKMQMLMIEKRLNAVTSTSAGRLFDGVSALLKERCDGIVSIPMKGKVNSFNVSTAAAILLAEAARQHRMAAIEQGGEG
jgi:hydrogenase maturation protein HypF